MMSSSLNENQRLNTNTNTNTNTNHPDEHDHRFAYGDNSNPFASPEGTILSPGNSVFEDSPYPFAEGYASSRARTTTNNQGVNGNGTMMTSPRPTLREEAERQLRLQRESQQQQQQQQQRMQHHHHHHHHHQQQQMKQQMKQQMQQQHLRCSTPVVHTHTHTHAMLAQQQQHRPMLRPTTSPHPLGSVGYSPMVGRSGGSSSPSSPTIANTNANTYANANASGTDAGTGTAGPSLVRSARKEWHQHGIALTQDLEETRRRDEDRPGTLTVRLLSAENRRDVTGRKYTAYVLRVRLPPDGRILQLEHRYSEFVKLRDAFASHCVWLEAAFPPKHLAGRIGNWQLAKRWAPDKHDELVNYRKVRLDVWLVEVTSRYNRGDVPHSLARSIYEFLTLSDRPPCDLENTLAVDESRGIGFGIYRDRDSGTNATNATTTATNHMLRWNNPIPFTLGSSIRQACRIVEELCMPYTSKVLQSDQSIPLDLLQCARGLIFLTVIKAGFVVSGRIGTGLLIARGNDSGNGNGNDNGRGWSAPCAIGTIGMGWGMLAGGDITHYLVVLTTQDAVETMLSGTVQLGTEFGVAIGPVGRMMEVTASASNTEWTVHPAYSYAHSKGFFVGMSIEGAVLSTRNDVNAKFYGRSNLNGADLVLDGNMPPPKAAEPLYRALDRALATEIPHDGFRPSQLFQESSSSSSSLPGIISGNGSGNSNSNSNIYTNNPLSFTDGSDHYVVALNDDNSEHGNNNNNNNNDDDDVFSATTGNNLPGSVPSYVSPVDLYGRASMNQSIPDL